MDQTSVKAVEPGGDGGVGGKKIASAGNIQGYVKCSLMILHVTARPFEHGKCRMTLIEMADFRLQANGAEQAPAANTKNKFLPQAHLRIAAIEFTRDAALRRRISEVVGVEKVELRPPDRNFPAAQPYLRPGKYDFQPQPFSVGPSQRANGKLAWIIHRVECSLLSLGIELLPEIALTVKQTDSHYGNTQITGRFHLVASHITQAARIDGQRFAQHELHTEIRGQRQRGVWVILLKPGV